MRKLGLPGDIVNIEGGAIALGHPIGATGAILTTRLIHLMRRDGLKHGVVTLCVGAVKGLLLLSRLSPERKQLRPKRRRPSRLGPRGRSFPGIASPVI